VKQISDFFFILVALVKIIALDIIASCQKRYIRPRKGLAIDYASNKSFCLTSVFNLHTRN